MKRIIRKKSRMVNKLFWISVLVFAIVMPSIYAQLKSAKSSGGLFGSPWFVLGVNAFVIFAVLFIAQAALIPKKEGKEKSVMWLITLIGAVLIAWFFVGSSTYIWKLSFFAQYLKLKIIVNTLIISLVVWFTLGLLDVNKKVGDDKTKKIGLGLLVVIVSVMVAYNVGDHWIWEDDITKATWDFLFGPKRTTGKKTDMVKQPSGSFKPQEITVYEEGILTLRKGSYRLFVFIASAMIIGWFFTTFLNLQNPKLTWAIVLLMSAKLTRSGSPIEIVIVLLEVFLILIIGKNLNLGIGGGFGTFINWAITILLVQFIFCVVFGGSAIAGAIADRFASTWIIGDLFKDISSICIGGSSGLGILPGPGKDTSKSPDTTTIPGLGIQIPSLPPMPGGGGSGGSGGRWVPDDQNKGEYKWESEAAGSSGKGFGAWLKDNIKGITWGLFGALTALMAALGWFHVVAFSTVLWWIGIPLVIVGLIQYFL